MSIERIERLRQKFLDANPPGGRSAEDRLHYARAWVEHRNAPTMTRRMALAEADVYRLATPTIGEDELIVGRPNYAVELTNEERAFTDAAFAAMPALHGQASHMAVDYPKLLRLGTDGLRAEIAERTARLKPLECPEDIEKDDFYGNCAILLDALDECAARYARHARELAKTAGETRRGELMDIAQTLEFVPKRPARSFREAAQCVSFYTSCVGSTGLYQLGRPDQYLLPYYEADIASGSLTKAQAQELIDCMCMLLNEHTAKSLAVGLMVGGRYPDGKPVVNDLTYLFIQSVDDVRLSYPGVGLCVTSETPEELLRAACVVLSHGCTHPALFNDDVIQAGLRHYGLNACDAATYIHSTCVEITPVGCSAVWVASPYYNTLQPLLELMGVGSFPGPKRAVDSFEALIEAWQARMRELIEEAVIEQNRAQLDRSRVGGDPLVACLVNDCLARGRDLDRCGARINFIESSFVGVANLVDSLYAVKKLVFDEKKLTMERFAEILNANYAGDEPLRQYILTRIPKYGNDLSEIDALTKRITGWISEELARHRTWRGDRFVPSMFCWIMHERLGRETPASPDGRAQGFPLGDGSGPAQGREHNGPTASVLSSTCWPHEKFIGGIAVNLKFTKSLFDGQSIDKMLELIKIYLARGGFELQINVVDRDKLLAAQKEPEKYRDLVVRIGGYSDYFVNLSPEMQQEVLLRTEHTL